jgi:hypothetical protein
MSMPFTHSQQLQANKDLEQVLTGVVSPLPTAGTFMPPPVLVDVIAQWRLVLLFYAAVHHVDEQLAVRGYLPSRTHTQRKRRIRQVWAHLSSIIADYEQLELRSREARYEGWVPDPSDLASAATILDDIEQQLV